jgi:dTDP-4-amino-4,6-dideoxygalactose transaminase
MGEYVEYLNGIWSRNWLTNNGPLVNELELKLKEYLDLPHLLYLNNGTIALQIAIKALDLKGEIITTPFSYVATTSAIKWEGCEPVFVDIDPNTWNVDPSKIEAAITPKTSGILVTHVYGNPCDIDQIADIAKRHNLKVIYDAAHCFNVKFKGKSVYEFGDVSTTSFHATKLFHTVEGGAVFTPDPEILKKMAYMRNFGHNGPEDFADIGINGKNSEFHAAFGLINLKYIPEIIQGRKNVCAHYDKRLVGIDFRKPVLHKNAEWNYAYYPILLKNEELVLKCVNDLKANWINARRYFFPTLTCLPYVQSSETPIATDIASRVLCLPLYHDLTLEEVDFIVRIVKRCHNY